MKKSQYLKRRFWKPYKPLSNPWMRKQRVREGVYTIKGDNFGKFDEFMEFNAHLDCATKSAALKASPFVVCLTSYIGIQRHFICSGTIVNSYGEDGDFCSTILTSATLLRSPTGEDAIADDIKVDVYLFDGSLCEGEIVGYDFHYNVAAIRIESSVRLQVAVMEDVDNSKECPIRFGESTSFQLVPHRDTTAKQSFIKYCPGTAVIALGRYFHSPHHIMAAPGKISLKSCELDCEELCLATCQITKNGIGGPLINYNGLVIGMNFYKSRETPFLPINIAFKCLEHLQNRREVPRPWLGIKISDLGTSLGELEKLKQSSPDTLRGIVVKKVESESPASLAGICTDDVIVQCDGKLIRSSSEFVSTVLDKGKELLELCVKRAGNLAPLTLTLHTQSAKKLNRWPVPEEWSLSRSV